MSRQHLVWPMLVLLTLAVFAQVRSFEFVNFDDDVYVTGENHVAQGLTWSNVGWAFSTLDAAFYHPLTWLSLMLDTNLAAAAGRWMGINRAGWFHLTNVAMHLGSVLLLFAGLRQMTGAIGRSAVVAALFAVHPLHVESVAWVTERKDVLSTFFGIAAVWGYARYARETGTGRNARWSVLTLVLFTCSLLSKSMLVTLPFVFLLLDYWPLGRLSGDSSTAGKRLFIEKLPFLALSALFCVFTYVSQKQYGAIASVGSIPFETRAINMLVVYAAYLSKAFWPTNLAVYYPHPHEVLSVSDAVGPALLLAAVSAAAILQFRHRPYLFVGWCWYLGTLFPVIGLVQLWDLQMADRFTYVPLVGVFVALAWLIDSLVPRCEHPGCSEAAGVLAAIAAVLVAAFTVLGHMQTALWKNSLTLFTHAIESTEKNAVAYMSLGIALHDKGRDDAAIPYLRAALRIAPGFGQAHYNYGAALMSKRQYAEAIHEFQMAIRLEPKHVRAYHNIGTSLADQNRFAEAAGYFVQALAIDPNYAPSHHALGLVLQILGRYAEALVHLQKAVELDPNNARAWYDLGMYYQRHHDEARAAEFLRKAQQVEKGH